jgi:hypothetical protein
MPCCLVIWYTFTTQMATIKIFTAVKISNPLFTVSVMEAVLGRVLYDETRML